jgi:hypothetical protein
MFDRSGELGAPIARHSWRVPFGLQNRIRVKSSASFWVTDGAFVATNRLKSAP